MSNERQPWEMTFKEYLAIVDPRRERHNCDAYECPTSDLNQHDGSNNYPHLLRRLRVAGLNLELRERAHDHWGDRYARHDADGNAVYDANGDLEFLTPAEVQARCKRRYTHEHAIVRADTKEIIGKTQDEWGCLLIRVGSEYRGFGLGQQLLLEQSSKNPFRHSGGFTSSGLASYFATYQRLVANALRDGRYRAAYRGNEMTFARVTEILSSAQVNQKLVTKLNQEFEKAYGVTGYAKVMSRPKRSPLNLNTNDPRHWLIKVDGNYAYIYDRKLIDWLEKDDPKTEPFRDSAIIGYAYVGGTYDSENTPWMFSSYGKTDAIKAYMMELVMNASDNIPLRFTQEDATLLMSRIGDKLIAKDLEPGRVMELQLKERTIPDNEIFAMQRLEEMALKHDRYGEIGVLIHEMADQVSRSDDRAKVMASLSAAGIPPAREHGRHQRLDGASLTR